MHPRAFDALATETSLEMIGSVISTVSMTAASLGLIDFIDSTTSTTSTISTTSSLSATSAFHGGGVRAGVLGQVGVGATRTDTTAAITTAATGPGFDNGVREGSAAP